MKVGVLKIGSTTVSWLLAEDLSRPLKRRQAVLNLIDRPDAESILGMLVESWLDQTGPRADMVLVGGGQALRQHPEWVEHLGLASWILSGAEEGQVARIGILAMAKHDAGMVIDIGGGSTEIVDDHRSFSLPVGVRRPISDQSSALSWPNKASSSAATIVGGAGQAVARLLQRTDVDAIATEELEQLRRSIQNRLPQWFEHHGIPADRISLVRPGIDILAAMLSHYHINRFYCSPYGLLEGLWLAASLGQGRPYPNARLDRFSPV